MSSYWTNVIFLFSCRVVLAVGTGRHTINDNRKSPINRYHRKPGFIAFTTFVLQPYG